MPALWTSYCAITSFVPRRTIVTFIRVSSTTASLTTRVCRKCRTAVLAASLGRPDLLICDIGLPEEDGYHLLKRVRSLEAQRRVPLAERMPAIALTGYAQPEDRTQALIAGFQARASKPAMPDVLLATAQKLLPAPG